MISLYRNFLGTVAQIREYQDGTILNIVKLVVTIQVRYCTILGIFHQDAGTNDRFTCSIYHLTLNGCLTKSIKSNKASCYQQTYFL